MELDPIIVPADWTPEQDFAFFEERFDEPDGDYFSVALDCVAQDYQELIDAADAALKYFEQHDHRLVPIQEIVAIGRRKSRKGATTTVPIAAGSNADKSNPSRHEQGWLRCSPRGSLRVRLEKIPSWVTWATRPRPRGQPANRAMVAAASGNSCSNRTGIMLLRWKARDNPVRQPSGGSIETSGFPGRFLFGSPSWQFINQVVNPQPY